MVLLPCAATAQPPAQPAEARTAEEREVDRWNSPRLTRFRSEREFRRYLRDLRAAGWFAPPIPPPAPPAMYAPPPPPPPPPPAAVPPPGSAITVTGTRIQQPNLESASPVAVLGTASVDNPQITNVQERGVDEGDIIKQVGRYLLVLQDGRVFSIDTRSGGGDGLALADRFNVYRNASDDSWYDEMLVFGDRVVVTGYSYDEEASQISVMRLGSDGRLRDEGTFFLSSNDYYDEDNYATRLAGDRLIVYTPIRLDDVDFEDGWEWPVVRRWRREEARRRPRKGRPVMSARSIYRPVSTFDDPVIHSVSICRLGEALTRGEELGCETRGFVGPEDRQMYVTPTDAWIWAWGDADDDGEECTPDGRVAADATHAWLYRLPLSGAGMRIARVRGEPIDQLSMAAIGGRFHALTRLEQYCDRGRIWELRFATVPLASVARTMRDAPGADYVAVPEVGDRIENRFTDTHLVYGGRDSHGSFPPEELDEPQRIAVLPVANPAAVQLVPIAHSLLRAERAGNDIVLTGYSDETGLRVSLVDLAAAPRIASTVRLDGRFETEGRSHAFNSAIGGDGSGLMGIPTAPRAAEAGRFAWRSGASDVSYLSVDSDGRLSPLGELTRSEAPQRADYRCEVSCVDWYGNSRPVFTGGRVFALTGTELIEGRIEDGRVRELRRLDLTAPPPGR
jgi:hypothetical protein